jgi:hypothetical protein
MTNQSENERIDILSNEQWEQLEKEHPYVDLLTDIGFKHVFGNPANKKLLIVHNQRRYSNHSGVATLSTKRLYLPIIVL